MGWGAAAQSGSSLLQGYLQSEAAKDAAKQQEQAAQQELLINQKATETANRKLKPFLDTGYESNALMNYLMGYGSPTDVAKTESNFDPEAYRNYLVERAKTRLTERIQNPEKLQKKLAKKIDAIDTRLETTGAWKDYRAKLAAGGNVTGEFWKQREGVQAQAAAQPGYGFLMQRFNNQLFEKDPGYQFRMDEGAKALESTAAARGGLLSGAALKAMQRYGQGFASNEYANAYNRFVNDQSNIYSRVSGQQDVGIRAAGAQGRNIMDQGQQAMQIASNLGDVRAAGTMGAANARASGYQNAMNVGMDAWGQNQAMMRGY